jgi:hypothetical protein
MNGRRPGNPAIHPKGAAGAFRQRRVSEQHRQRRIGKRERTGSMAVLAVPARQTVQTVWRVQTRQDRKEPADQVEAGLLDRARPCARLGCTGWNW